MSLSVARSSVATFTFLIFFYKRKKNLGPDNSKRLHSFIAPSWVLAETGYYMRALDHHPDMKKKKKKNISRCEACQKKKSLVWAQKIGHLDFILFLAVYEN